MATKINDPFLSGSGIVDPAQSAAASMAAPPKPESVGVGDFAKVGAGSVVQAFGGLGRGLGEMVRQIAPDSSVPGAIARVSDSVANYGSDLQRGVSKTAAQRMSESTPSGELFSPSTWSLGEDPSLAGYGLNFVQGLGSTAPTLAAGAVTKGKLAPSAVAAAATGGGFAAQSEQDRINEMTDAQLQAIPRYADLVQTMTPQQAKAQLAAEASQSAFRYTAPVSAADALTEVLPFSGAAQAALGRVVGPGRLARTAAGAVAGGAGEAVQETAENAAQIVGANVATGETRSPMEDSFQNALMGALVGGPISAAAAMATPPSVAAARQQQLEEEARPSRTAAAAEEPVPAAPQVPVQVESTVLNPQDGALSKAVALDTAEQTGTPLQPVQVTTVTANEQEMQQAEKTAAAVESDSTPESTPAPKAEQSSAPQPVSGQRPVQQDLLPPPAELAPVAVEDQPTPGIEPARTPASPEEIRAALQARAGGILDSTAINNIARSLNVPVSEVRAARRAMRAEESAAIAASQESTNGNERSPDDGQSQPDNRAGAEAGQAQGTGQEGGKEGARQEEGTRQEGAGQEGGRQEEGSAAGTGRASETVAGPEAGQRRSAVPNLTYDETPEQLDGDTLTSSGAPFTIRDAAERTAARTLNAKVIELEDGGFVVRTPTEANSNDSTQTGGPVAVAEAAPTPAAPAAQADAAPVGAAATPGIAVAGADTGAVVQSGIADGSRVKLKRGSQKAGRVEVGSIEGAAEPTALVVYDDGKRAQVRHSLLEAVSQPAEASTVATESDGAGRYGLGRIVKKADGIAAIRRETGMTAKQAGEVWQNIDKGVLKEGTRARDSVVAAINSARRGDAEASWARTTSTERAGILARAGVSTAMANRSFDRIGSVAQEKIIAAMDGRPVETEGRPAAKTETQQRIDEEFDQNLQSIRDQGIKKGDTVTFRNGAKEVTGEVTAIDKDQGTLTVGNTSTGARNARKVEPTPPEDLPMPDQTYPLFSQKNVLRQLKNGLTRPAGPSGRLWTDEDRSKVQADIDSLEAEIAEAEKPKAPRTRVAKANTIFTEDAAEKARKLLRSKLGQLNSGIDPEMLQAGITLAGYHIEKGARTFTAYARAMLSDLGEGVRPYLKSWYMGVKYDPRASALEGLDTAADVEAADVDAITAGDADGTADASTNPDGGTTNERGIQPAQAADGGPGALETAPAAAVPAVEGGRAAGAGADRSGQADASADGSVQRSGDDRSGGVAGSEGRVPDSGPDGTERAGAAGQRLSTERPAESPIQQPQAAVPANYRIPADLGLGDGGQKSKFNGNVAAIKLLRQLEAERRIATPSEQAVLARYVGWGGIPQAFARPDGTVAAGWEKQVASLAGLLTEQELDAARRSTQDAHYTSPEVIGGIYSALERMGFRGGAVLEPAMGTGNFLGLTPDSMHGQIRWTGIELDSITGRIAKQLYPESNIVAGRGFQEVSVPVSHFDAVVGNPPFGEQALFDSANKDLSKFSIHNFFFAKSIKSVKPGGVVAMVVSNSLMDKASSTQRRWMADRARLLGAIRLPNTAFRANAGTDVTTDIVFLQRLHEGETASTEWTSVGSVPDPAGGKPIPLNQYFIDNPEMMLGDMTREGKMRRAGQPALIARAGTDLGQQLQEAIDRLPANITGAAVRQQQPVSTGAASTGPGPDVNLDTPIYSHYLMPDGSVRQRLPDVLDQRVDRDVELSGRDLDRMAGMIRMRDALKGLMRSEMQDADARLIERQRAALNRMYDGFVKDFGYLNSTKNVSMFRTDADSYRLRGLEAGYTRLTADEAEAEGLSLPKGRKTLETAQKADILRQRVLRPSPVPRPVTASDALMVSMNTSGRVDVAGMAASLGTTQEKVIAELGSKLFLDPTAGWVTDDQYLSGNVKAKLAQAIEAAAEDPDMRRNVEALQAVQPADLSPADISAVIGSAWIPGSDLMAFAREVLGADMQISWNQTLSRFTARSNTSGLEKFSTSRVKASALMEAAINRQPVTVYDTVRENGSERRVINQDETASANSMLDQIGEEFADWIWKDRERRERLSRLYNDNFNTDRQRSYDGSFLTFPGKSDLINFRPSQQNAIWRMVQDGRSLLDHVVGAGKTYTVIGAAMTMKRMGLLNKPMVAVPNHLVGQWAGDWMRLYPGANVLAVSKEDFTKDRRKLLFSRIATGDWDAVIVAHSQFTRISVPAEFEAEYLQQQVDEYEDAIVSAKAARESGFTVKQLEKRLESFKEKQKANAERIERDTDTSNMAEMGIDGLFVDEAHEFKNLGFATSKRNISGLGNPSGSQKAADLFMKTRYLAKRSGGNLHFATGTPVSNSLAEMFTMQRYLAYEDLRARGMHTFDAWANTFALEETQFQIDSTGRGLKPKTVLTKFVNVAEMMSIYWRFGDIVSKQDLQRMHREQFESVKSKADAGADLSAREQSILSAGPRFPIPRIAGGRPENVVVPAGRSLSSYIETDIIPRTMAISGEPIVTVNPDGSESMEYRRRPDPSEDNMLKVTNDARLAALDVRLRVPDAADDPNSKVNEAVKSVIDTYRAWAKDRGTQLIFCDLSTPKAAVAAERAALEELQKQARDSNPNEAEREAALEKLDRMSPDEITALESSFSVYDDMREKLIKGGIPANEIAFIHDAKTDLQKKALFTRVNSGQVRILMGSTQKMGAGTNVQERLVGLHHLDAPWRPSDLEQREGRIERQGNMFYARDPDGFEVQIRRYATERTYDSRMWQLIEQKANVVEQVRSADASTREIDDIGGQAANAAEMKAAATGNPLIIEQVELASSVKKLQSLRKAFSNRQYDAESRLARIDADGGPEARAQRRMAEAQPLIDFVEANPRLSGADFTVTADGKTYTDYTAGADALAESVINAWDAMKRGGNRSTPVGRYRGATLMLQPNPAYPSHKILAALTPDGNEIGHTADILTAKGNISGEGLLRRVDNLFSNVLDRPAGIEASLRAEQKLRGELSEVLAQPFRHEAELEQATDRLRVVNAELKAGNRPTAGTATSAGSTTPGIERAGTGDAAGESNVDAAAGIIERTDAGRTFKELLQTRSSLDAAVAAGSARQLMDSIAEQPGIGEDQRLLAQRLGPMLEQQGVKLIAPPQGSTEAGLFSTATNTMWVRQAVPSIALHEALHGVTSAMMTSPTLRRANANVRAAMEQMEATLEAVRAHVRDPGPGGLPSAVQAMLADGRGPISNTKELLAYGMTDKAFQSFLAAVPMPGASRTRNAWGAFKAAIARMLGLRGQARTALDSVMDASSDLIAFAESNPVAARLAQMSEANRIGYAASADPAGFMDKIAQARGGDEGLAQRIKDKIEDLRPGLLSVLTLRQIADVSQKYLPAATTYVDDITAMGSRRNTLQAEIGDIASKWQQMQAADRRKASAADRAARNTDSDRAVDLMHDSTIAGVDGAEPYKVGVFTLKSNGDHIPLNAEAVDAELENLRERVTNRETPASARKVIRGDIRALQAAREREAAREDAYPAIKARFDALPPAWQDLYREVRDSYSKRADDTLNALIGRVNGLEIDGSEKKALVDRLRANFESARVEAPYFPLARFGEFWASLDKVNEDGTSEPQFVMAETKRERDRAIRAAEVAGYTLKGKGRRIEQIRAQDGASGTFVADVNDILTTAGVNEKVRDDVYQLYLRTMPELSMRKNFIHRKKVAGYDTDALRAFANNMFHSAHQLAKLEFGPKLDADLKAAQAQAKEEQDRAGEFADSTSATLGELKRRHEWVLNPTNANWAQNLSSLNFVFYLGVSPAAALVNLSQTAITTLPSLAARHGWMKSMGMLLDTVKTAASDVRIGDDTGIRRSLKTDGERRAYDDLRAMGAIDVTQSHDLAGLSETGTQGYSPLQHRVMNGISFLFHKAEVINREATGIAAYRLAIDAGASHAEAVKQASDTIWETHFDYSSANRARIMQSDAAKVLFAFKQYSQSMTYFLWRNLYQTFKGDTPQVRREAAIKLGGTLGMTGVFAGVMGMPLMSVMFGVANAVAAAFGDDDDPFDAETEFRNFLADMLGPTLGRVAQEGVLEGGLEAMGISAPEFGSRVSLDELWLRSPDADVEGRDLYLYLLEQAAGPIVGMAGAQIVGAGMIGEAMETGNGAAAWRGVEKMMPKAVRDGMKTVRLTTQGANTVRGDALIEDVDVLQSIYQGMGFSPAEVQRQYQVNASMKEYEKYVTDRRSALITAYALGIRENDTEMQQKALEKITSFNEKYPALGISSRTLRSSLRSRQKYSEKAVNGIVISDKVGAVARQAGRFGQDEPAAE